MTTYASTNAGSGVQPRSGVGITAVFGSYELLSAVALTNNVFQMVKIPQGAVILEVILATDDLDSSTGLVLDVGDGTTHDRFISGQTTVGRATGVCRLDQVDGLGYQYTADDTIDVTLHTQPSGAQTTGTINLTVIYTMQDDN
jgi:hypothetical protein